MPKFDQIANYRKKKIIHKKIKNIPPWTGTPQEKWAIEGRAAQKRLRERRDQAIEETRKRRQGQRSK